MIAQTCPIEEKALLAHCRSCNHGGLIPVLDLGAMPLSDGLLSEAQLAGEEERFPLELVYCPHCALVQILETVPPEKLFCEDYPYYSSFSDTLLKHSRDHALELIFNRKLGPFSLVVELASNDGYMLRNFVERSISVLGIDPASGPAEAARKTGVETLNTFFTWRLAEQLRRQGKAADVIIANNVLAHVSDTNGFVAGIKALLKDTGVASIEFPYVRDLIDQGQFDTIYHEHLCYFSLTSVDRLFRRHQLFINEVRRLPIHGGSLRLYIEKREAVGESVTHLLAQEKQLGLDSADYYRDFGQRVQAFRERMRSLLTDLKQQGHRIAAYGAAAKGTIMVNYLGVDTGTIEYVVDRNSHKQGRYVPGARLPICDPGRLAEDRPDYCVILPWNFRDEIVRQQQAYRDRGGRFIVPIPALEIV